MADKVDIEAKIVRGSIIRAFVEGMPFAVRQGALQGMKVGTARIVRVIRTEKLNGQLLDKRTGTLSRAVFGTAEDLGDDVVGVVGVDLKKAPQGRVQELGGVIKPVRSSNLTIPLDAAKTGKGVARFSARDVIDRPESYGYVSTFFRNHVLFGVKKQGTTRTPVPLFVLKKMVTLKPVGYIGSSVKQEMPNVREDVLKGAAGALKRLKLKSDEVGE